MLLSLGLVSGAMAQTQIQEGTRQLRLKSGSISRLNLLDIDYFDRGKDGTLRKPVPPKTLRILVLRVSFQPDTLATTTGDGRFILTPNDSTIIDPPPHDRSYFQAQLQAASHYYATVSNNRLALAGDVYPFQEQSSYVLPHDMAYYNPDGDEDLLNDRLAELFRDAVEAADNQDQPPFSNFDVFVVFHAGVGQDFASDFDLTPNDIPSAFLNTEDLRATLGNNDPGYPGIPTSSGLVREGLIVPETQNQEGSEFAVKATFILLLGRQFGLPSLSNTDSGVSGIGAWGLMDAGASNYFGLMPAQPTAWSKVFMGWEDPVILHPGTGVNIATSLAQGAPRIYKIPITGREYFLIENRNHDHDGNGFTTGEDQFGHPLQFSPTGQFTAELDTSAGDRLGVITTIHEYDFALPGSGVLIWHIDDQVIEANYATNRVNADAGRRGVDLEEADGSQDIGQRFGFLSPGSGSELGVAHDAYYAGNEIHQLANEASTVAFSATTVPGSQSQDGANTHVALFNFSAIDTIMQFDYANTTFVPGFPRRFAAEGAVRFAPTPDRLPQSDQRVIYFTPGNQYLFAWDDQGNALIAGSDSAEVVDWRGQTERFALALMDSADGQFTHFPISNGDAGAGEAHVFSVIDGNRVVAWSAGVIDPGTGFARRDWEIEMEARQLLFWRQMLVVVGRHSVALLATDGSVIGQTDLVDPAVSATATQGNDGSPHLAILGENTLRLLDASGQDAGTIELPGPASNLSQLSSGFLSGNADVPDLVFASDETLYGFTAALDVLPGFPLALPDTVLQHPITADIDADGFGEVVLATRKELLAYNHNGTLVNGFPLEHKVPFPGALDFPGFSLVLQTDSTPYIISKNGLNEIIVLTPGSPIELFDSFSGGGAAATPLLSLADIDGDGIMEMIDANSDGLLRIRKLGLTGGLLQGSWLQPRFDAAGTGFGSVRPDAGVPPGPALLPYAYNYPNPTEGLETRFRFFLEKDAQVDIAIFDLAGEFVTRLNGTGLGRTENEIVWPLGDVASGIYMARLEASDGSQQEIRFVKVAVVK